MAIIHLHEQSFHTHGNLPKMGDLVPNFVATKTDLSTVSLSEYAGKPVLINAYPSIDTNVCFTSVKKFQASINNDVIKLCISMDLPFALKRVSEGECLTDIVFLSDFRNREFGDLFGLSIADGPLAGLLARAVIVLDGSHKLVYKELVSDISTPPDYQAALSSLSSLHAK